MTTGMDFHAVLDGELLVRRPHTADAVLMYARRGLGKSNSYRGASHLASNRHCRPITLKTLGKPGFEGG